MYGCGPFDGACCAIKALAKIQTATAATVRADVRVMGVSLMQAPMVPQVGRQQ